MWYNKETQELQSDKPWGAGWVAQEIIEELYHMWEEVEDFFVPPAKEPTKKEKIEAINAEYNPQIQDIQLQICIAQTVVGDSQSVEDLKAYLSEVQEEFEIKRSEIING